MSPADDPDNEPEDRRVTIYFRSDASLKARVERLKPILAKEVRYRPPTGGRATFSHMARILLEESVERHEKRLRLPDLEDDQEE